MLRTPRNHIAGYRTWRYSSLIGLVLLTASSALAAPTLKVSAYQEARRPNAPTGIPVWEPMWWAVLDASGHGQLLSRVEFRGGFQRAGVLRPQSGGWDLAAKDRESLLGRVRVSCETLADYDEQVELRLRVVDASGEASDWVTVRFPPEDIQDTAPVPPLPTTSTPKKIGKVSYLASDEMTLSEVRAELLRLARLQGGAAVSDPKIEPQEGGKTRFTADVMDKVATLAPTVAPAPTPGYRDRGRIIGEVKLRTQRW